MSCATGGSLWQIPYVNFFKHFDVGKWKKSSREGDVTSCMDRDVKATVFRVSGSVPANNFIMLPKSSSQSLSITGSFLYLLFRPLPCKYFVIHLEVVTSTSLVVRISFSNLFKEFKSTSTWLQFPYRLGRAEADSLGGKGGAVSNLSASCWIFLSLNLKETLSKYLSTSYSYLKSIKLCANILVKNVFTSDIKYSPLEHGDTGGGAYVQALPREMSLPLPKGAEFLDVYDYVCFPYDEKRKHMCAGGRGGSSGPPGQPKQLKVMKPEAMLESMPGKANGRTSGTFKSRSGEAVMKGMRAAARQARGYDDRSKSGGGVADGEVEYFVKREVDGFGKSASSDAFVVMSPSWQLAEHGDVGSGKSTGNIVRGEVCSNIPRDESRCNRGGVLEGGERGVHMEHGANVIMAEEDSLRPDKINTIKKADVMSLQPDPILKLSKAIGFGGVSTGQALFCGEGSVVYPCHSIVVAMDIASGEQKFFTGHTNKVSCISLSQDGSLLASGQTGCPAVVRVWDVLSGHCLGLFQTHRKDLHSLSFSASGSLLCGVGRNSYGKTQVVLWDVIRLRECGDVSILARAHTEASIQRMRVSGFDDRRMVSCGWNNVRFWRVKGSSLRSCPVDLEGHHQMHFTDVQFQPGYHTDSDLSNRSVYACTTSGHLFEIHYKKISILRVWHLVPDLTIHSLALHEAFCITGSEDGILRVWPMDFSAVYMEAEHEGEVTSVDISSGFKVLAGTSAGNLGILDATTQKYSTLMRSHADQVTSMSVSLHSPGYLITSSNDKTIRVWNLPTGLQASHWDGDWLAFSPSRHRLFSCSSTGSLAVFSLQDSQALKLLRLLGNIVAKEEDGTYTHRTLSLSQDGSRLALIGPFNFTITVLDAENLDELLRLDITPVSPSPNQSDSFVDTAKLVYFSPRLPNELLVVTKETRLLRFCASSGRLLNEVPHLHKGPCSCAVVSRDGRYLVTAGDQVLKVWDYTTMETNLNFQVFIGHCGTITDVCFTPDAQHLISCGDAIFIWKFMGVAPSTSHLVPEATPICTPSNVCNLSPSLSSMVSGLRSASPRKQVPIPAVYDPLKMQAFTPVCRPVRSGSSDVVSRSVTSNVPRSEEKPYLDVDDDQLYEGHGQEELEEGKDDRGGERNINQFQNHVIAEEEDGEDKEDGAPLTRIDPFPSSSLSSSSPSSSPSSTTSSLLALPPPTAAVHLVPRTPKCGLASHLYIASGDEAGIERTAVWGVNGPSRNNLVWQPDSGLFVFSSGCLVVIEDLSSGKQKHMEGHVEEVSCVAVQHDGCVLASTSPSSPHVPCQIRVWNISSAKCIKLLTFHRRAVQSLSYSPDDRLLLSIGNYQDGSLAVWGTWDYSLLAATSLSHPIHAHEWDPHTAYEFVTVGVCQDVGGVRFWMLEEDLGGMKCQLKLHEPHVPEDLLHTQTNSCLEFTCVSYGKHPSVFVGSNNALLHLPYPGQALVKRRSPLGGSSMMLQLLFERGVNVQGPPIDSKVLTRPFRLTARRCTASLSHSLTILFNTINTIDDKWDYHTKVDAYNWSYLILDSLGTRSIHKKVTDKKLVEFGEFVPVEVQIPFEDGVWDSLLHNDALTIHFIATFTSFTRFHQSVSPSFDISEPIPRNPMKVMLKDEVFSDATIKVGGKTFKVHKVVLASQSDVFRNMFEADMKERRSGIVKISGIDPEVMSDLLAYIYTGTAPNLTALAKELLFAADKYNLAHLVNMCACELVMNLTYDNVIDMLLLVDKVSGPERVYLQDACIKFIRHNPASLSVVSLWETTGNTCLLFWRAESCEISCLLASADGKLLAGNVNGVLQLWHVTGQTLPTGTPPAVSLKAIMDPNSGMITSANFNRSMELGVVSSSSGIAWYINWPERSKLKLVGGHSAEITAVSFSADSSHLASASLDGSLAVWDVETREQLVVFQAPHKACSCVAFAPQSRCGGEDVRWERKRKSERGAGGKCVVPYVVAGYGDGTLRVFDVPGTKVVKKMQPHATKVTAVSYSQNGHVILSSCSGGVVAVSNPTSGLVVQVISDHQGAPITDLHVAPNPIQLPCLGEGPCWLWLAASCDRRVSVWSGDWQRDICQLLDWLSFPGPPTAPDGTQLKKGSKCQYELLPPSLARFVQSDPDTIVYTGYGLEQKVQFYSISKKSVLRTCALTHWAISMAVSPHGHLLVFGCQERILKLMDYDEGSFQDFTGHHDSVGTVTFSPSGNFLVSTSNSAMHLWTVIMRC